MGVKGSITYREITVAIGILVAMVIALTLWVGLPEREVAGAQAGLEWSFPSVKQFFQNPQLFYQK